jgi:hypothetical protein
MTNGNFYYNGIYTPGSIHSNGWYRLKLEVTAPNGLKEAMRCQYFSYDRSGFTVIPGKIQQNGIIAAKLIPGQTYYDSYQPKKFLP